MHQVLCCCFCNQRKKQKIRLKQMFHFSVHAQFKFICSYMVFTTASLSLCVCTVYLGCTTNIPETTNKHLSIYFPKMYRYIVYCDIHTYDRVGLWYAIMCCNKPNRKTKDTLRFSCDSSRYN